MIARMTSLPWTVGPWRNAARLIAEGALQLPWRTMLVVVFLILGPACVAAYTHVKTLSEWDYYTGEAKPRNRIFAHREATLSLAERASYLQATAGDGLRYRWTEQAGGEAAGYVETRNGYLPLATQEFGVYRGRKLSVGLVENDLGAIVLHATGVAGGECNLIQHWMSDYTKMRASGAFIRKPIELPRAGEAVQQARWEPLGEAVERCKSTGEGAATILMRFDGYVSPPGRDDPR